MSLHITACRVRLRIHQLIDWRVPTMSACPQLRIPEKHSHPLNLTSVFAVRRVLHLVNGTRWAG